MELEIIMHYKVTENKIEETSYQSLEPILSWHDVYKG